FQRSIGTPTQMAPIRIATAPTAIRSAPCRLLCGITMSSTAAATATTTRSTNGHSTVFQCGLRIRTVRSPSDRSASAMCTWWHGMLIHGPDVDYVSGGDRDKSGGGAHLEPACPVHPG